jgi:hypothetical protein
MSTPAIVRRFRKELREYEDIQPEMTITLNNDPKRAANTRAAQMLLEGAFNNRVTIDFSETGIICGSREEAAIYRLQEYTRRDQPASRILLSEVPAEDIQEYLNEHNEPSEVFVPASPEQRFVYTLAKDFQDIIYGL